MQSLDGIYLFLKEHWNVLDVVPQVVIVSHYILKEIGIHLRHRVLRGNLEPLITFRKNVLSSVSLAALDSSLQVLNLSNVAKLHHLLLCKGEAFNLLICQHRDFL